MDELMHYGVKGMKWRKRKTKSDDERYPLNTDRAISDIASISVAPRLYFNPKMPEKELAQHYTRAYNYLVTGITKTYKVKNLRRITVSSVMNNKAEGIDKHNSSQIFAEEIRRYKSEKKRKGKKQPMK